MADNQEQLFNEFADLQALEAQQKKILDIFGTIKAGIKDLSESGIKINSSTNIKSLGDAINKQKKQQDELSLSINEYNKLLSQKAILEAKLAVSGSEQAKSITAQKLAIKELNKEQQLRIQLARAEQGSIDQLQLKIQKATLIYERLSEAQRNSGRGGQLLKFIQDVGKELTTLEQKTGNFRRNVGNYANSLASGFDKVAQEIEKLKAKQQGLQDFSQRNPVGFQLSGGQQNIKQVTAAIEQLEQVQRIGFNTNNTYSQSVKQIEKAYQDLAVSGNVSNEFLQEFKKFAAEAKDRADDLRTEIKLLSSDTRGIDQVVSSLNVLTGVAQGAAGAQALFGNENEDVQKSIQKLVAIQSVANAVQQVGTELTKQGTIANKAYAVVQGLVKTAMDSTATASARLNAVLKLSVVGLVITGIAFLISKLSSLGDQSEKTKGQIDLLSNSLDRLSRSTNKAVDDLKFKQDLLIEKAKQRGATEKEVSDLTVDGLRKQANLYRSLGEGQVRAIQKATGVNLSHVKTLKDAEQVLEKLKDSKAQNDFLLSQGGIMEKIAKKQKEVVDGAVTLGEKVVESLKKATETDRNATTEAEKFKTKTIEDERKKKEEQLKKALENSKNNAKEEKKAAFELSKFRLELAAEEQRRLSDDVVLTKVSDRVAAAQKEAEIRKQIITEQQTFELSKEKITASEKKLINEKAANDIAKINDALSNRIIEIRSGETARLKEELDQQVKDFDQAQEEKVKKAIESAQKTLNVELVNANRQRNSDVKIAGDNFKNGLTTKEQYLARLAQIEFDTQNTIIESQLKFYDAQLEALRNNGEDTTQIEQDIANARIEIEKNVLEQRKKLIQENISLTQELKDKNIDLFNTIQTSFESIVNGVFDRQKNRIQEQIDDIERLKAAQIDQVNASGDSEEQKANRIKLIESKAQADKERLQQRQRQLDYKKAVFERAVKVFEIGISTNAEIAKIQAVAALARAQAQLLLTNPLTAPLYPAALANVALITAQIPLVKIGALASLVALLATPIPKFALGKTKDDSYEGLGLVGEAGRELEIDKKGNVKLHQQPTLTYLARGTTILPNRVTEDILNANSMTMASAFRSDGKPVQENQLNKHLIEAYEEQTKVLRRLEDKPVHHITIIENQSWHEYEFRNTKQ